MARDLREPKAGLDRNKYYKGEYTNKNKLTRATECEGVFYSMDYESISKSNEMINGVKHIRKTVKLSTKDFIPDLDVDYFVLYNAEYWIVESVVAEDVSDSAKPYERHSNSYIVSLKL